MLNYFLNYNTIYLRHFHCTNDHDLLWLTNVDQLLDAIFPRHIHVLCKLAMAAITDYEVDEQLFSLMGLTNVHTELLIYTLHYVSKDFV